MKQAGGEAVVMYVDGFAGLSDAQLVELFQTARAEEYGELGAQLADWEGTVPQSVKPEDVPKLQEGLSKLRRRYAEIKRVDYFSAPEGLKAADRLTQAAQALIETAAPAIHVKPANLAAYRNRRWVTRTHPHVDRLACMWLIRRFIDPAAIFDYGAPSDPDDVTYDMPDADFGHTGNLCTFETMLRAFNLQEPSLDILAQIVHEIDLRDGLYARPEMMGIDSVLSGWLIAELPDRELELHGIALFDGLFGAIAHSSFAVDRATKAALVHDKRRDNL